MYTQCPECLTIYKLGAEVLAQGHGSVRCGHCAAVFDALRTLAEQLPPEPVEALSTHAPEPTLPQLSVPALRPSPKQISLTFDPDERQRRNEKRMQPPTFARPARALQPTRTWPWKLGVTVLLLGLLAQLAYAERDALLNDARVRPWIDVACSNLGCHLPLRHDPGKLELLSRDIRPHPSVANALIISATLRNAADFAQAFPAVEITLSDLDENRVGMRRFQSLEYVSDPRTLAAGMAPGATAAIVFEVADPGKNAVAFEFKFL